MNDSSVFSPLAVLALVYLLLALGSTSLLFSRPSILGGLPARIYLLNMAHGPLAIAGALLGHSWQSLWCLVGAVGFCALTGAQLAIERGANKTA